MGKGTGSNKGTGSILDKYELGGVVGEGSYGTVHKAKNKETGESY